MSPGALPALAALGGLVAIWRRDRRLAAAFGTVLTLQAALTVFYLNIPANFFRPFDRHYLPVCVTIAVLAASGLGACAAWARAALCAGRPTVAATGAIAAILTVAVPVVQFANNWTTNDASWRYFARDYAANALRSLPPDAIYFTVGDNDTFPVLYLQAAEGMRPDVTIINLSVANIPEWPERLRRRDPALPLSLSTAERLALTKRTWPDSPVMLPVAGRPERLGLVAGTPMPDAIALDVRPRVGPHLLPAEALLLDIVRTNRWRRPLTFATTGTRNAMEWLAPYGRLEGLYFRIVPLRDPPPDVARLRSHLFEATDYRGYAHPRGPIDDVARIMASLYYGSLSGLLDAERETDVARCHADVRAFEALVPISATAVGAMNRPQTPSCAGGARDGVDRR